MGNISTEDDGRVCKLTFMVMGNGPVDGYLVCENRELNAAFVSQTTQEFNQRLGSDYHGV